MTKKDKFATILCIVFATLIIAKIAYDSQKTDVNGTTVSIQVGEPSEQSDFKEQLSPQPSTKGKVVLVASGDIIPARSVNVQTIKRGDFTWAFKHIAPVLKSGDITLINMEAPLMENCPQTQEGFVFCGDARHIQGLELAGVDVVNVANNHFANYGQDGIDETMAAFNKEGIIASGLPEQPVYKEVNGTKFAFLGYNDIARYDGITNADNDLIAKQVKEADQSADVVVVSMHWGVEYVSEPNERQKELAYLAIDNGADLIVGNHPHWVQSDEYYKGVYIKYAHGNTIFDQMWSEETKKGVIGKYTFENAKLKDVEFTPTYIIDYGQATLL